VVLPAGGAALSWLLLMTLWLPMLDFARSYAPMVAQVTAAMPKSPGCVATLGLNRGQIAALQFHGQLQLQALDANTTCLWLIADIDTTRKHPDIMASPLWQLRRTTGHPAERKDSIWLYERRLLPAQPPAAAEKQG
jgi:hypothetical protein